MPRLILAGDVGGTKTLLGLFREELGHPEAVREAEYATQDFDSLEAICAAFLKDETGPRVEAACFGVPGAIIGGNAVPSNISWSISDKAMSSALGGTPVLLLNDLGAMAYGLTHLPDSDFEVLNHGASLLYGNIAVIAAGTGLGESALLASKGGRYSLIASEGGHASFAPQDEEQIELLRYLAAEFGHVSWERVLSGHGLANLYRFLCHREGVESETTNSILTSNDPAAAIADAALSGRDRLSVRAVELFCSMYGAEAANLALKVLALGGVYLGGGIARKILPFLKQPAFIAAFTGKGRLATLLNQIEVRVVMNPRVALIGAAFSALTMV